MGSIQPRHAAAMAGWLETVQRDPRSMGAFRRRIEAVLCDPAVARRIARRLKHDEAGAARPAERPAERPASGRKAALRECARGTIFGRCDCDGACRLMAPDLQHLLGRSAPPVLVDATRH